MSTTRDVQPQHEFVPHPMDLLRAGRCNFTDEYGRGCCLFLSAPCHLPQRDPAADLAMIEELEADLTADLDPATRRRTERILALCREAIAAREWMAEADHNLDCAKWRGDADEAHVYLADDSMCNCGLDAYAARTAQKGEK